MQFVQRTSFKIESSNEVDMKRAKEKNYSIAYVQSRIRLVSKMFRRDTKFIYIDIEFIQGFIVTPNKKQNRRKSKNHIIHIIESENVIPKH